MQKAREPALKHCPFETAAAYVQGTIQLSPYESLPRWSSIRSALKRYPGACQAKLVSEMVPTTQDEAGAALPFLAWTPARFTMGECATGRLLGQCASCGSCRRRSRQCPQGWVPLQPTFKSILASDLQQRCVEQLEPASWPPYLVTEKDLKIGQFAACIFLSKEGIWKRR